MKIKELIEKLQELDQDTEIQLFTGYVEEYVDRGVFETVNYPHSTEVQVFIKHENEF